MTAWPGRPVIHEINNPLRLRELRRRYGHPVTWGEVPAAAWDEVVLLGVDAVWLEVRRVSA
ncbi:hypothetical protein [Streptomyces sp. NPDC058466]|uniref:hypothetical protein n=1 Tax=Streptomyces sp. NPDC058466 TaxID=3346512 RepID=UPI00365022DF